MWQTKRLYWPQGFLPKYPPLHWWRRIVHISHYGPVRSHHVVGASNEFLRKQRQRLRLSDFFRPTWEDLVGLRVISVNLISLGLMHKSFTCWFIYSEMACEDNL